MYYKYIKKTMIIFCTFAIMFPLLTTSSFLENIKTRNLQEYVKFSDTGIFYNIKFPKNDITGTGDKLQDSAYRALCITKRCANQCCTGEINDLICASQEQCKQFYDTSIVGNVAAAIIIPISIVIIFFVAFHCFYQKSKKKGMSALLAFGCIFIITIPLVIFIIWKYKLFKLCEEDEEGKKG